MPLILGTNSIKDTGYNVANSCRFNAADTAYMHKTPGSASNRKTFTVSAWVKRCALRTDDTSTIFAAGDGSTDDGYFVINWNHSPANTIVVQWRGGEANNYKKTTQVFRDISAWYHVVCAVDTTQAVEANRLKFYINGTQVTSFGENDTLTEDFEFSVNSTEKQMVGVSVTSVGNFQSYLDAYQSEVCLIDGSQLTPSSFGEFDSDSPTIWKPTDVSELTFGTNGFYLDFEASGNLGNDVNGGTDLTEVNLAATDQATDTPTNNFCTMLPITKSTDASFTEGNLNVAYGTESTRRSAFGTMAVANGKWYWETTITATSQTSVEINLGISSTYNPELIGNALISTDGYSVSFFPSNGYLYIGNTQDESGLGNAAVNDIFGHALNMDDGTLQFYKNGSALGSANDITTSGSNVGELYPSFTPAVSCSSGDQTFTSSYNFGSPAVSISSGNADGNGYGNFEYAPPSGFLAICTKNLGSTGG